MKKKGNSGEFKTPEHISSVSGKSSFCAALVLLKELIGIHTNRDKGIHGVINKTINELKSESHK